MGVEGRGSGGEYGDERARGMDVWGKWAQGEGGHREGGRRGGLKSNQR
jgi:hypothetical protein